MCFGKTSKWGIGTCLGCDIGGWLMKKGGGAKDKEEVRAREKPRRNKDQDRIRREGAPETSGGETAEFWQQSQVPRRDLFTSGSLGDPLA